MIVNASVYRPQISHMFSEKERESGGWRNVRAFWGEGRISQQVIHMCNHELHFHI